MSRVSHEELQRIFEAACRLELRDRTAYIDEICRDAPELRAEVQALLAADAQESGPIDAAGAELLAHELRESGALEGHAVRHPERIGRYRILRVLNEGGMGIVYEAEQDDPRRRVAVKVIRPSLVTGELLQRFRNEARVLGHLRHSGIAQIFEAATTDSGEGAQPFFAMELVEGRQLTEHADAHDLNVAGRLELVAQLCDVLHYAHQRGVIHRDLKPSNILVAEEESRAPTGSGSPTTTVGGQIKILDFGVARAQDADLQPLTLATTMGQLIGTVSYVSPEQAEGDPAGIDARTDVYSLGVIAYELLVGRLPLEVRGKLMHEAVRIVREEDPSRLGVVDRRLRGDVETIVAKAMEKEKDQRYSSAAELAADIRRFLASEPIHARPTSAMIQLRKFARRNKAVVGGALATLAVAIVGAVVAGRFAVVANRNASTATERADRLERASYLSGIAAAHRAIEQHDFAGATTELERLPPAHRGWEYDYLRARLVHHLDEWETPAPLVCEPVFGPAGRRMFAALRNGSLGTWELASGRLLGSVPITLGLSRDFTTFLLSGSSKRFATLSDECDVVIGSLETGEIEAVLSNVIAEDRKSPLPEGAGDLQHRILAWDGAGHRLLYHSDRTYVWDGEDSIVFSDLIFSSGAYNHAGDQVILNQVGEVSLFDAESGDLLGQGSVSDEVLDVAFAPDDSTVALACSYRNLYLLDASTLKVQARLTGHRRDLNNANWTAGGSLLVTSSLDETLRIWSRESRRAVAVHVTSERLGAVFNHSSVLVRDPGVGSDNPSSISAYPYAAVMPDQQSVVVTGDRIRRYPLEDPSVLRGHSSYVYHLEFSPDGSMLASTGFKEAEVHLWDVHLARPRRRLRGPEPYYNFGHEEEKVARIAFSDDSKRLVSWNPREIFHWDVHDGTAVPVPPKPEVEGTGNEQSLQAEHLSQTLGRRLNNVADHIAMSADGLRIAICHMNGTVELQDIGPDTPANSRPPARALLSGSSLDERYRTPSGRLEGHEGQVYCVAFHPDGSRIATGGNDGTVRIWDAQTCELLLVLRGHDQYVKDVEFSPDGTMIASASGDFTIRLWDTKALHERRAMAGER